ncbi:MAG: DJ-1/PfpI family protein, partial [Rhodococcus ruber]|nr:DJ-1/PfpI family protein [Rhodococcus ruber]
MSDPGNGRLAGRTVAVLATNGVEEVELVEPRRAVEEAGGTVRLLSLEPGEIQAMKSDVNAAGRYRVDQAVQEASVSDFDALILPGGTTTPDHLRQDSTAVAFVRDFV